MNQLISVIIPVYNTSKSTKKLLEKLLDDKYKNLEIIVVDDGSKDDSLAVAQEIAHRDQRVKAYYQKNSGQSAARNLGIKKSHGEYLIFIDSDDMIADNFISSLVNAINKPNTILAVTGIHYHRLSQGKDSDVFINKLKPRQKHETFKSYILRLLSQDGRMYSSVNKIFRSDIIKNNKIFFDEKINFAEDTKFVLDYLAVAQGDIEFILEPLYIYNYGTETSTISKSALLWKNWQNSYKNLVSWVGKNPKSIEKKFLHRVYLRWYISHSLAVARSNQKYRNKLKYAKPLGLFLATILKTFR